MVVVGVLAGATAGATAYFVSVALPKVYESEAKVLVGSLTDTNTDNLAAYRDLAQTYAELAVSSPVLDRVIQTLQLPDSPLDLQKRIDVRAAAGMSILRITARAPSAQDASALATAIGSEIVGLATPLDAGPILASIVQPGPAPNEPSSPRVLLNTAVAALFGACAAAGLVYVGSITTRR
jgi:polysaccharide biosynthesis transport protein